MSVGKQGSNQVEIVEREIEEGVDNQEEEQVVVGGEEIVEEVEVDRGNEEKGDGDEEEKIGDGDEEVKIEGKESEEEKKEERPKRKGRGGIVYNRKPPTSERTAFTGSIRRWLGENYGTDSYVWNRVNEMIRLAENGCGEKGKAEFTWNPQWTTLNFSQKKRLLSSLQNRRRAKTTEKGIAKEERKNLKAKENRNVIFFFSLLLYLI